MKDINKAGLGTDIENCFNKGSTYCTWSGYATV